MTSPLSEESKKQAELLAKNLGKIFAGVSPSGSKDLPKPLDEVGTPAPAPNNNSSNSSQKQRDKLSDIVFKNLAAFNYANASLDCSE